MTSWSWWQTARRTWRSPTASYSAGEPCKNTSSTSTTSWASARGRPPRQALGECLAAALPEDGVEGIDRVLIRLRQLLEALVHRGVAVQLFLKGGESKGLDQVVDDAAVHRGP